MQAGKLDGYNFSLHGHVYLVGIYEVFGELLAKKADWKGRTYCRLGANPVLQKEGEWRHQVGWRPEGVKNKVGWLRGGSGYERVGSEEASPRDPQKTLTLQA